MNTDALSSLEPPTSVLDIGANIGGFYSSTSLMWPNAKYTLVEGNPACSESLRSTGQRFMIALLGDKAREVDFYLPPSRPTCTGGSYYKEVTNCYDDAISEKRLLATLSDLLPDEFFDFIKIDVQGAELDVIRGGLEIFRSSKHVMMEVSVQEYNRGAPLMDEVLRFMAGIGFTPQKIMDDLFHPSMGLIQHDILFGRNQ